MGDGLRDGHPLVPVGEFVEFNPARLGHPGDRLGHLIGSPGSGLQRGDDLIIPAVVVILATGEEGLYKLLILSQVVLSLQLPFAVVPLVKWMRATSSGSVGPISKRSLDVPRDTTTRNFA